MSKFNVGDKVKLKRNLVVGRDYDGWTFTKEMKDELWNKVLTISYVDNGDDTYHIMEFSDSDEWFSEGMFNKARQSRQEQEEALPDDLSEISETLKEGFKDNSRDISRMLDKMTDLLDKFKQESPFEKAMKEAIIEKGKEIATENIEKELKEKLEKFIQENYGVLPKPIIIQQNNNSIKIDGIFHKDFEKICNIVANDIPLMLVGGAGAGKNYTLEQVAKGLGLTFYSTNAINQEYKLTGFIDANGVYHETEFYKAFKNGGMFFLDEIDASSPEALIILNSAIANRYFDFPIGRIEAHKDFRVVCAGNTYGTGADMVYVGRNVLDGATLDRFVVLNFDYDEQVEKQLAYNDELYYFIKDLRDAINQCNLRYIVSMRALINSTKLLEIGIDKETILKTVIIKNMQRDDINTIVGKLKTSSDWTSELRKLSDRCV